MAAHDAPDCITAVSGDAGFDKQALRQAGKMEGYTVDRQEDRATVTGRSAVALARLLNLEGIWLEHFEDDWMLQAAPGENGGTAG